MAGHPKATQCRFCKKQGLLIKGAHPECKKADDVRRQKEKRGPNRCKACGKEIGKGCRYCPEDNAKRYSEQQKAARDRYKQKVKSGSVPKRKGRPPVVRPLRKCYCGCGGDLPRSFPGKYLAKHFKPAKRVRPAYPVQFKEPDPKPENPKEEVVIKPPEVVVRRIESAGWMTGLRDLFGEHGKPRNAVE